MISSDIATKDYSFQRSTLLREQEWLKFLSTIADFKKSYLLSFIYGFQTH